MLSSAELVEAVLSEMGDPDELSNAEDLIILKLGKALPAKCRLPTVLALKADSLALTTDCRGFVGCCSFLLQHHFPVVLFAGLPDLKSTEAFLAVAKEVLRGTQTLIVMHNRNTVTDLGAWFPSVERLFLPHNLKVQKEEQKKLRDITIPNLKEIYGTMPAVGSDKVILCSTTLLLLVGNCPMLSEVHGAVHHLMTMENLPTMCDRPLFRQRRELVLGLHVWRPDGNANVLDDASPECVARAAKQYPHLKQLQLTTKSKEALHFVTGFSRLTHLSLLVAGGAELCPFGPHVISVLRKLSSSLTHLTLNFFSGLSVATVGRTCRNLQGLALRATQVCEEHIVPADLFPKLTSLSMDDVVPSATFYALLCTVPGLTELRLQGNSVCGGFLAGPRCMPWRPLVHLRHLTLGTRQPLASLCVAPEEVRTMFELLPSLETLRTDSYDIRLYVQNYCPRVKLAWTSCTMCAAEFPRLDAFQESIWQRHCGKPNCSLLRGHTAMRDETLAIIETFDL